MKLALGLVVVVALLGATGGAQIRDEYPELNYDVKDGVPPSFDDDSGDVPEGYDDPEDVASSYGDDLEKSGMMDTDLGNELVDVDSFNMSIFPREEDIDKSLFISEKDSNLTGSCAMPFYMPNRPRHCGPQGQRYFYVKIGCHRLYPAVCHTCYGDVTGFYYRGRCYYNYGGCRASSSWRWVGLVYGRAYLYRGRYHRCGIFGGYQKHHYRPLYMCAARHGRWLIPGKLHREYNRCYYLNRSTTNYYSLIAC